MQVAINGEPKQLAGETIEAVLAELGLLDKPCAVEVNRQLVPARDRSEHRLADGDSIEIVTLVGGG